MKRLDQVVCKAKAKFSTVTSVVRLRGIAIFAATTISVAASAQPTDGGGHRGPPAEAVAACKSLAAGAACGFTAERGAMKGSCWAPEGKPLACKPKAAPSIGEKPASQPK